MPAVSSVFLVLSLVLAAAIGGQTLSWSWGPSLLAVALAALAAIPNLWKHGRRSDNTGFLVLGIAVAGWFAARSILSPVKELGMADLLLLTGAVSAFFAARAVSANRLAERVFAWGVALFVLANVAVLVYQIGHPRFAPIFASRPAEYPSGFIGHYNEAANFLIGCSFLTAGLALFGSGARIPRVVLALISVAGLTSVFFTGSRGGILSTVIGAGVFGGIALLIGKRRKAGWFTPVMIALPILALAGGLFLYFGWSSAQEMRQQGDVTAVTDNPIRLALLGIAVSCVELNPWAGGGSRSFSWNCFQFWNPFEHGWNITRPEQVHNELLQSATDYGMIGMLLILVLLGTVAITAAIRSLFSEPVKDALAGDAYRAGGVAALAGMFVQSNFSFVFHLVPGAILLGIALGFASFRETPKGKEFTVNRLQALLATMAIVMTAVFLLPNAWRDSRVTQALWSTWFSKELDRSPEARIAGLAKAIELSSRAEFLKERGLTLQALGGSKRGASSRAELLAQAREDLGKAAALHPYDPVIAVNLASLSGGAGEDAFAEKQFQKAVHLQGGMETGFRVHLSFARYLTGKGMRHLQAGELDQARDSLIRAGTELEASRKDASWVAGSAEGVGVQVGILEGIGLVEETAGNLDTARRQYDEASRLSSGNRLNYRMAQVLGKMAYQESAARRAPEALARFIQARERLLAARELPAGVREDDRSAYLNTLDQAIQLLTGAKIQPAVIQDR